MKVELDGQKILTEKDFHAELSKALDLPRHYGANLDALWDVLSTDIERPITLIWMNSAYSKKAMKAKFDDILEVLQSVEKQDIEWELEDIFKLEIS